MPEDLPGESFPQDTFGRRFTALWYYTTLSDNTGVHLDWSSYSASMNKVYRLHCMLYGNDMNPKTYKSWVTDGFNTRINGSVQIQKHTMTKDHIVFSITVKVCNQ